MFSEPRCTVCRTYLDPEDLFCSNCGTENPQGVDSDGVGIGSTESQLMQQASVMSYRCEQCGASMSYDASAKTLRCPFCGGTRLTERKDARTLRPASVVPFQIPINEVERRLRNWLSQGFWKPGDASQNSVISKVTEVYVPFWVFSVSTETAWTGDSSAVTSMARGTWRPVSGTRNATYDGILVGASGILTANEVQEIAPFDLSQSVKPEEIDLTNVIVEEFRVTRRDARRNLGSIIEQLEANDASKSIPGSHRNLGVNVRIQNMRSVPVLLPIWIMAYQYRKESFRVLVNGQTGEVYGAAPFSYAKLTGVIAAMFVLVLLVILVAVIASAIGN